MDFLGVDSIIGGFLNYGAAEHPLAAAGENGFRSGRVGAKVEPHIITRAGYKSTSTALDLLPAIEKSGWTLPQASSVVKT